MEEICSKKRGRVESANMDSDPFMKRFREDFLENLEAEKFHTGNGELELFMKNFDEGISSGGVAGTGPLTVVDSTSETGESNSELGYLLEASDDELGLPPYNEEVENAAWSRVESPKLSGDELSWNIEPDFPSYEFFEINCGDYNYDYVTLDGLFDYSDVGFGLSDLTWRPES